MSYQPQINQQSQTDVVFSPSLYEAFAQPEESVDDYGAHEGASVTVVMSPTAVTKHFSLSAEGTLQKQTSAQVS